MDILIQNGKAHYLYPDGAPELHPDIEIVSNYDGDVAEGFNTQGSILVFPSYLTHRITNVTEGKRNSLVAWAEGPRWQ